MKHFLYKSFCSFFGLIVGLADSQCFGLGLAFWLCLFSFVFVFVFELL